MASIRWLHLTDLHVGMHGMHSLWPSVDAEFHRDLAALHKEMGGFDVVLFSGDLVFSGQEAEYNALRDLLDKLWARFQRMGSRPALLCVPGNHDLIRPKESSSAVRGLLNWSHDQDLRGTLFWDEAQGREYRAIVESAFSTYTSWKKSWDAAHPLPDGITMSEPGLLPGDFAATIRKDGLSLGVVGLNSAFLHLSNRTGRGQLALHPHQINKLCGGDPDAWAASHDLCFLMTHHPPDWLAPDALALYQGAIFVPYWFAWHFCGHMHDPQAAIHSFGGSSPNRLYQGASLFGLETWKSATGTEESRIHGYSAGRLDIDAQRRATIRFWPRCTQLDPATRRFRMIPDYLHFSLESSRGNSFEVDLGVRPPPAGAGPRASSVPPPSVAKPKFSSGATWMPQPPGRGYDPAWYVERETPERNALIQLGQPGSAVHVVAPPMSGKSTTLRRIADELRKGVEEAGRKVAILSLDLGTLSDAALDDTDVCLREIAELIVEAYAKRAASGGQAPDTHEWVEAAWKRQGLSSSKKLRALFERRILEEAPENMVALVMDRFDHLMNGKAVARVSEMLRSWLEDRHSAPWSKLRMLLAVSGTSLYVAAADLASPLLNASVPVRLEGFGVRELRRLAELYRRAWSDEELEKVIDLVDGQPYLSRLIFFLESTGTDKAELLDIERLKVEHCAFQLRQMWLFVKDREELRKPLCELLRNPALELSANDYINLHQAGLVRRQDGRYVVPKLLSSYFREQCFR